MSVLKVFAADWCPHCRKTMEFLKQKRIPFEYLNVDSMSAETEAELIRVNGGEDWCIPTLEYEGKWRPGEQYDEQRLKRDLSAWGLLPDSDD